ncbi:MAG: DsbC family protein [Lautropia sp.]
MIWKLDTTRLAALATAGVFALLALAASALVPAHAQVDPKIAIRASVEQWLKGRYPVDDISATPLANMYEVRIGTDLIYVDARGEYAFVEGQMIDLKKNANLTQARIDEVMRIDFRKDLPFDAAIKQVNGNGSRVLAVFEDPNCTYCKKFRRDLVNVKDITVYTFPYPILAADSDVKSRKALCAPDKVSAWNEMMIAGKVPANDGSCETPIARIQEVGRKLRITGTPTMFFANGKRIPGGISVEQLEAMLKQNG